MPLKIFQESKNEIRHIIGIAAGKGGVGKSSITVNLALALKQKGFSVGILDADIYGPSLKKMLPPDVMPSKNADKMLPALSMGVKIISMAYFRSENEASAVRAPIANSFIQQFLSNVFWGQLDYLLIDFPPGTGDVQLTIAQKANLSSSLIVTTPQEVALIDVRKAMNFFDQVKIPILGIVENMSFYLSQTGEKIHFFGKGGGKRLSRETGIPFLSEVPLDPYICACQDSGTSLFQKKEAELAASYYLMLADSVVEHSEALFMQRKEAISPFELLWKEIKE